MKVLSRTDLIDVETHKVVEGKDWEKYVQVCRDLTGFPSDDNGIAVYTLYGMRKEVCIMKIDNPNYDYLRKPEQEKFQQVVGVYLENGYTATKDCLDHFFMFNPKSCWSVKLYYSGGVQEKLLDG